MIICTCLYEPGCAAPGPSWLKSGTHSRARLSTLDGVKQCIIA